MRRSLGNTFKNTANIQNHKTKTKLNCGHIAYVWSTDNTILETSASLWIIREPMSGRGQWPKLFAMPFDKRIQAWFESEVARGYYGDPDMYRKK